MDVVFQASQWLQCQLQSVPLPAKTKSRIWRRFQSTRNPAACSHSGLIQLDQPPPPGGRRHGDHVHLTSTQTSTGPGPHDLIGTENGNTVPSTLRNHAWSAPSGGPEVNRSHLTAVKSHDALGLLGRSKEEPKRVKASGIQRNESGRSSPLLSGDVRSQMECSLEGNALEAE